MSFNAPNSVASPDQLIASIGESIAHFRLARNLTQATLASEAGISLSTLKRLEHGDNPTLDSVVRVFQALGLGDNLAILIPDASVRPLERAATQGKQQRKRARPKEPKSTDAIEPWTWEAS